MNTKQRLVWMFITLSLAMIACQLNFLELFSSPNSILYADDFETTQGDWQEYQFPEGQVGYSQGGLRFQVWQSNSQLWSTPDVHFRDVHIEVEAQKISGDENDLFGLICRGQKNSGFYAFLISSDGYFGIGRLQDNQMHILGDGAMPPSEIIRQGQTSNQIRADCVSDILAVWVNGFKLADYRDEVYTSGYVGLFVGTLGAQETEVVFDNFVVSKP